MRSARAFLLLGALAVAAAVGCNAVLGLEERSARPAPPDAEAGTPDATPVDEAGVPPSPIEACHTDADCTPPNGCYTPHCETATGACTYALCEAPGRACAAGTCDTSTFTCGPPVDYGFRAARYGVTGVALACGSDPDACVAAVFPFLFLGTADGATALRVDDLLAKSPSPVPVGGLALKPSQIVASGRRVWVIGEVQGGAPPYTLAVASIDVPSDPGKPLAAVTSVFTYPFPEATAFPAPGGALFLVYDDVAAGWPAARVEAPPPARGTIAVVNPADAGAPTPPPTHPMYRVDAPAASNVVASSGDRLLAYRAPGTFNLVTGAASPAAAVAGDQALAMAPLIAPSFAQGPDGSVVLSAPVNADQPLPNCNCITNARVDWPLPNAVATTLDATAVVFPAAYTNPQTNLAVCHSCEYFAAPSLTAWIGAKSALVAVPGEAASARKLTSVRLVGHDPATAPVSRRASTVAADKPTGNFETDRVALTSSAGFGYLVLANAEGNEVNVSIFDPRCDAK